MFELHAQQSSAMAPWFQPERPGPMLIGPHVITTGNGRCWADHWPDARALLVESAGNYTLQGDPRVLRPGDLRPLVEGMVDARPAFEPLLRRAFPNLTVWQRVILTQRAHGRPAARVDAEIRHLTSADCNHLQKLSAESAWIGKTWGGADGLAASGYAWGAFVEGRLASVACTFFVGHEYEEIGVVTEPAYRGLGLSPALVAALCRAIAARGRRASWTTSPDNRASLRVAEKNGFTQVRTDQLYVVGIPIPRPASPST